MRGNRSKESKANHIVTAWSKDRVRKTDLALAKK